MGPQAKGLCVVAAYSTCHIWHATASNQIPDIIPTTGPRPLQMYISMSGFSVVRTIIVLPAHCIIIHNHILHNLILVYGIYSFIFGTWAMRTAKVGTETTCYRSAVRWKWAIVMSRKIKLSESWLSIFRVVIFSTH